MDHHQDLSLGQLYGPDFYNLLLGFRLDICLELRYLLFDVFAYFVSIAGLITSEFASQL